MSTRLWGLLSSPFGAEPEIAEIAADPELKAEAKRFCQALAEVSSAAGEAAVRMVLQPLVLVYGVGEAARSPAFWEPYRFLAGLPAEALKRGVDEYTRQPDSLFFPKPGPLKALCDKHAEPIYRAAFRASKAVSLPPPTERKPPSDEEKAAVARLLREFEVATAAKNPEHLNPTPPSSAGKPDQGGITPELRAILARQRGEA